MPETEPSLTYFTVIGAALCLGATTGALLVLGADIVAAIALGFLAAIIGGAWGLLWARRA